MYNCSSRMSILTPLHDHRSMLRFRGSITMDPFFSLMRWGGMPLMSDLILTFMGKAATVCSSSTTSTLRYSTHFPSICSLISWFWSSQSLFVGAKITTEVDCLMAYVLTVLPNNLSIRWEWTTHYLGNYKSSPNSSLPTCSIHFANATS